MRLATGVLVVILLGSLTAAGVYGGTALMDSGSLTAQWTSETARELQSNHHPVATAATENGPIIVAPVNELNAAKGVTDSSCSVVRLNVSTGATEWQASLPKAHCNNHAITGPTIADIDEDGGAEVVVATSDATLNVYDAATGALEWRAPTTTLGYSEPAVADLLPAPGKEIVVADMKGNVSVVYANGSTAWRQNHSASTWANPQVADFDGDGRDEIAIGTSRSVSVYEADGELVWRRDATVTELSTGHADDDAQPELFVGGRTTVAAIDGADGERIWSTEISNADVHPVADGDGDGTQELYLTVSGGDVRALDATDGSTEWSTQLPGDNQLMPPASMGDLDGNGRAELVIGTQAGVTYVLDPADGSQLASYEREVPIYTYPAIADIDDDGDGELLVMYGDGRVGALSFER
jgi:outer membrane protein assembly factor BamB